LIAACSILTAAFPTTAGVAAMILRAVALGSLLFLLPASCGSKHPLAAHWHQDVAPGAVGLELWFDDTDMVGGCNHQPGDADDDLDGHYSFADGKVVITAKWKNSGKLYAASGPVTGDHLELVGDDSKMSFHRADH
jgi:hypothetical protein